MKQVHIAGSPYQAGVQLGNELQKSGLGFHENYFLPLTPQRRLFGARCLPVLQAEYPEILEELRGVADSQDYPFEELCAFIFGIYNFPPLNFCTCFATSGPDGVIFGRNSDFIPALEESNISFYYRPASGYAFIGNSTAFCQIEDGVNEYGLAAGLTLVPPAVTAPGLNAGLLVRYLLERCKTVAEAIAALRRLTISSSQTITLADRGGEMAVAECNCERLEIRYPGAGEHFVAAANDFHSPAMQGYHHGLADDIHSQERYRVAYAALQESTRRDLRFARELLRGRYGFMCQYDREAGTDTVWSSLYLLGQNRVLRCEGNPARQEYQEDARLSFR